jgi:glycosyltransferase involved in cell wall biosynthesis
MKIGIEIHLWGPRSGLYYHCWNLLQGLARLPERQQFVLFYCGKRSPAEVDEVQQDFPDMPLKHFQHPGRPYNLRMRFNAVNRVDVFQYISTINTPVSTRRVNSFLLPDLTTVHYPQFHLERHCSHWKQIFDVACSHGDLLITSSEHTRLDVITHLGIPAEKVKAIPLAAAEHFTPIPCNEATVRCLESWGLQWKRYILSVGVLEPRKNHILLLKAYRQLKDKGLTDDHKLVFSGGKGWLCEPIFETIARLGLEDDVKILGHADPLQVLYSGASVMVYPSLYEGFGLPPLEAMACGTPVITSNTSSLPEVVGDAGMIVDPHDPADLADAMRRVLSDSTLREHMRQKGLERAQTFSWDKTAAAVMAAYEQAYQQKVYG